MLHAPYEPLSGIAPFTYALSGAHICIPGEKPAEFESLLADIKAEMKPIGPATQFLVEEMAQCQWKLRRSTVILRDHYRFLLNVADYKTVGNAFLRDNIGVHSITKLARYDNLLRRAWRECYELLLKTRERSSAGEPRAQQAGPKSPLFSAASRQKSTQVDSASRSADSSSPISGAAPPITRQNSTLFDTPPPFSDLPAVLDTPPPSSELRPPISDLPSVLDTLPPFSDLRSPISDLPAFQNPESATDGSASPQA